MLRARLFSCMCCQTSFYYNDTKWFWHSSCVPTSNNQQSKQANNQQWDSWPKLLYVNDIETEIVCQCNYISKYWMFHTNNSIRCMIFLHFQYQILSSVLFLLGAWKRRMLANITATVKKLCRLLCWKSRINILIHWNTIQYNATICEPYSVLIGSIFACAVQFCSSNMQSHVHSRFGSFKVKIGMDVSFVDAWLFWFYIFIAFYGFSILSKFSFNRK